MTASETASTGVFKFEFDGSLIDPETTRGHVAAVRQVGSISMAGNELPVTLHEIEVVDPFVEADPKSYRAVSEYVAGMEQYLAADGFDAVTNRTEASSRAEWNRYTGAWTDGELARPLGFWRGRVPFATALEYLINPRVGDIVRNRRGEQVRSTPESAAQFRFVVDGIGIRTRGVAMGHLLTEHCLAVDGTDDLQVLSLASGTAEPVIAVAAQAQETTGKRLSLTVADLDEEALSYVRRNAERYGFDGSLRDLHLNILEGKLAERIAAETGRGHFDVVENMGFVEYLPQDGDELGARKGAGLPQASEFTRRAFELVKPGGVLLSGNMILDRPQKAFVFGIVDWPLINARSEESILRVYDKAGMLHNPDVKVEMFRVKEANSGTHVYNIVKATRLAA